MHTHQLLPLLFLLFIAACSVPEQSSQTATDLQWYKGNLHTHSYWSDGDDFPEMIMDWYKSRDYDFMVLSDHNILAQGEKWKLIPKDQIYQEGFEKYLNKYGEEWVNYREDSTGRLEVKLKTLEEYRPLFEEEGKFLIIESEEVTDQFDSKPIHMNLTNVQELVEPQGGTSVANVMQRNLDKVAEQREATGVPMFLHLNHPNFGWAVTPEDIIQLSGERFFEVYNGHPMVHNYGDSLRPGMEALWDQVQTAYLNDGKPLIYGLAVDDAHSYHIFDGNNSNPGRGWVVVRSSSLAPTALIEAMEKGDFYSSTGVTLEDVHFDGSTLNVSVAPEDGIEYTIQFFGTKKSAPEAPGVLLTEEKASEAQYTLQEDDLYARAKIISTKLKENPYKPGDTEVAWTQPVVLE